MKKILAFLLAAMMVLAFAACGEDNGGTPTPTPDVKGMSADVLPRNAMTPSVEIPADFKIGMICLHDENSTYDNNFIQALRQVQKDLGLSDDQVVIVTNIGEDSSCYDAAVDLAKNKGCKVIFADSFGHESFMKQAAQEYPEVQFCHATGTSSKIANIENFHNAFASIYEGRYLAGIAAGLKLNEMIAAGKITAEQAVIGYVGAFTYAEVISGYTSFFLGARSVCPTATMEVTFTGSWYDEALEKEGAQQLIANGCKLISQHADSFGAPTACENAKVPNVSYNGSTKEAGPNTYIISSRIDWAPYYEYAIKAVMEGKTIDTDWTGTLATGSVVLEEINDAVAAKGTAEAIEAAKAKLEKGELHVFDTSTFTTRADDTMNAFKVDTLKVDGDGHITSYMADVDTDANYTGDTEAIKDGYFAESSDRSAPYFDLQIAGITLLNTKM